MTIRGHHFRRGVNKNMVAFKRKGAKVVLVPAGQGHHQASDGRAAQAAREGPARPERHAGADAAADPRAVLAVRQALHQRAPSRRSSAPRSRRRRRSPRPADPNGDCDGDGQINRVDTDDDNDLLTDDVEKALRPRQLQGRHRRRQGRGRLRVPVGARPQRRRAPDAQRLHPVPGEASVPERARQDRRRHRPRRRRPDAARGVPALEGHARERRAAHARRGSATRPASSTRSTCARAATATASRRSGRRLRQAGRVPGWAGLDGLRHGRPVAGPPAASTTRTPTTSPTTGSRASTATSAT